MRHEWDVWWSGTQSKCETCGLVRQSCDASWQYTATRRAVRFEYLDNDGRWMRKEPSCMKLEFSVGPSLRKAAP